MKKKANVLSLEVKFHSVSQHILRLHWIKVSKKIENMELQRINGKSSGWKLQTPSSEQKYLGTTAGSR